MKVTSDTPAKCIGGGGRGGRGGKDWPPGFRFHPTDEELILYYLKRKICRRRRKLDIIAETDVYKWDPEELPALSILKTGDRQWFFFSPRDRKYPNGGRSSRATRHGYWKATGKDRIITCNSRSVGLKKTLVFYQGRAPNGERTDWVMHEYTLDEEELKRCQNVQDYYALYKVYKKSGPGPKNGEQYGAPFNEEDWTDDDFPEFDNTNLENALMQPKEVPPDDVTVDGHILSPLNDTEFMKLISDEPVLDQQQVDDRAYAVTQVFEEERQSTLVDPSFGDVIFPEPIGVSHQGVPQCDAQGSFGFTQSATSHLQLYEAPEVTSAQDLRECVIEDDFLEIDDLLGPEPTFLNMKGHVENLQFEEIDGLSEFDLFHDAAMLFNDIEPINQGTVSNSYVDNLANNMINDFDYQLQSHQNVSEEISNQLWTNGQTSNMYSSANSNQGAFPQLNSGVVYESPNLITQTNQNPNGNGNENSEPRSPFSAALWAFVESIPSSPASAAENVLVNRAFERMSSFGRVRIIASNTNTINPGTNSATIRRATRNRVFIILSILGVICAILWVMIGTKKISRRCILS